MRGRPLAGGIGVTREGRVFGRPGVTRGGGGGVVGLEVPGTVSVLPVVGRILESQPTATRTQVSTPPASRRALTAHLLHAVTTCLRRHRFPIAARFPISGRRAGRARRRVGAG